jgi:hypothetical protein
VLVILAYPEVDESEWIRFAQRYRAREFVLDQGSKRWFDEQQSGIALPIDSRPLNAGLKRLEARVRKRLDAGLVALDPLVAADTGGSPLRRRGNRWSRRATVAALAARGEIGFDANFESRVWNTSLAVMHIAAAWAAMLKRTGTACDDPANLAALTSSPPYLASLVDRAEKMESLFPKSGVGIPTDVLIKIRMAQD